MRLLEMNQVSKTYRGGSPLHKRTIRAVRDVSLSVEQGECLAIVGESGSGKSTLLRLLAGLEAPDVGEIRFCNQRITPRSMDRDTRRAIQMVYQNSFEATNPRFTALQVVEEPLRYFHLAEASKRRSEVAALLEQVGIPAPELEKKVYEFSGGQLQRICIARALAAKPKLLLLDEPLSSLDVSVQAQILNLLKDLQEAYGLTYVLISHDMEMVYNLSDHLAVLFSGTVVEEITDMEMFDCLRHPYTDVLLQKTTDSDPEEESEPLESAGCVYARRCPYAGDQCRREAPPLIEIEPGHRIACHRETKKEG